MGDNTANNTNTAAFVVFRSMYGHEVTLGLFILSIIRVIIAVTILTLNGIVLDSMIKRYQYEDMDDRLVIGLALSSAGTGVCLLGHVIQNLINYQSVEECLLRFGMTMTFLLIAGLHLVSLTINRFFKMFAPFGLRSVTDRQKKKIRSYWIPLIWLVSLVCGMLPLFGWNNRHKQVVEGNRVCSYFGIYNLTYLGISLIILGTSALISLILYIAIFCLTYKNMRSMSSRAKESSQYRATLRYAKIVFALVGVYVLCWTPYFVLIIIAMDGQLDHLKDSEKDRYIIYTVSPVYITCISSPLIYAFGKSTTRSQIYRLASTFHKTLLPGESSSVRRNVPVSKEYVAENYVENVNKKEDETTSTAIINLATLSSGRISFSVDDGAPSLWKDFREEESFQGTTKSTTHTKEQNTPKQSLENTKCNPDMSTSF